MLKFNNYQKTVILWGLICFFGFIGSQFGPFLGEVNSIFLDLRFSLILWLVLTAIGLFFQVYWMWYNNISSIGSQITWIFIGIVGWVLTYFKLYGYILSDLKSTSMWLGFSSIGMVLTAIFYRNNFSYYLLALGYFAFGLLIQYTKMPFELVITGIIFLGLGILDAYLEHSKWRKGLAEI